MTAARPEPPATPPAGSAASLTPPRGAAQSGPLAVVAPQRASGPDPHTPVARVTGEGARAIGSNLEETDGQRRTMATARSRTASQAGQPGTRTGNGNQRRRAGTPDLQQVIAAGMAEADLEENIRDACKKLGILRFHVYSSRKMTAGFPDDILIGPGGILWRECKTQKGKASRAQIKTGEALLAAGQNWSIWRPADWLSGRILTELTAISRIGRAA